MRELLKEVTSGQGGRGGASPLSNFDLLTKHSEANME